MIANTLTFIHRQSIKTKLHNVKQDAEQTCLIVTVLHFLEHNLGHTAADYDH